MGKILQLLLISLLILLSGNLKAQQDAQFSQYFFNKFILNPAVAGTDEALNVTAFYRNQWTGLDGHPVTQSVSAEFPLYYINSGVGVYFLNEGLGQERNTTFKVAYSYITDLANGKISFGAGAGVIQKSVDGSKLTAPEGEYNDNSNPVHNDPFLPDIKVSTIVPDFTVGVYFNSRKLNVGISANHILEPTATLDYENFSSDFKFRRHLLGHIEHEIRLNDRMVLQPSALVKSDLTNTQVDFSSILFYNNNLWGGLSFRGYNKESFDAVIGMVGLRVAKNLMFGYSYDFNISALRQVNSGSHEIFINYRLGLEPLSQGKIINNPRYLFY